MKCWECVEGRGEADLQSSPYVIWRDQQRHEEEGHWCDTEEAIKVLKLGEKNEQDDEAIVTDRSVVCKAKQSASIILCSYYTNSFPL